MFSTWLGVVLLFAIFGAFVLVVLKVMPRGSDYEKKRAEVRAKKLEDAQKENLTALTTYAWVDKNKGVARIPINQAMQIMLVELPDKKPKAAGPIAAPSPSVAPQTSPAASASAPPTTSASTTPKPTSVSGPNSEAHNEPAAAVMPPPAPPNTQPGPNSSVAPAPAKPQTNPSPAAAPSAPGTPLPVRGKTP